MEYVVSVIVFVAFSALSMFFYAEMFLENNRRRDGWPSFLSRVLSLIAAVTVFELNIAQAAQTPGPSQLRYHTGFLVGPDVAGHVVEFRDRNGAVIKKGVTDSTGRWSVVLPIEAGVSGADWKPIDTGPGNLPPAAEMHVVMLEPGYAVGNDAPNVGHWEYKTDVGWIALGGQFPQVATKDLAFVPAPGFTGTVNAKLVAQDGEIHSTPASVQVTIRQNRPPKIQPLSIEGSGRVEFSLIVSDEDEK